MIAVALSLVAVWLLWAFLARVTIVEVSRAATIEADPAPLRLQSPVNARVLSRSAELGATVEAGDVIFTFDKEALANELEGQLRLQAALPEQLRAIEREVTVIEGLLEKRARLTAAELAELRALRSQEAARTDFASREEETLTKLSKLGVTAPIDRERATSRARQSVAAARALEARLQRMSTAGEFAQGEQEVRVSRLMRDAAELRAEGERIAAKIAGLETRIKERVVRAPKSGVLVAIEELSAGAVVTPGQWLATLVPPGDLRVVAQLDRRAAAKVKSGQLARLEVDGYPWTQYGTIACEVTGISDHPSEEGELTVFLAIRGDHGEIPIRHGHSGRVEIEVEKVSPAILALRAAGLVSRGDGE